MTPTQRSKDAKLKAHAQMVLNKIESVRAEANAAIKEVKSIAESLQGDQGEAEAEEKSDIFTFS